MVINIASFGGRTHMLDTARELEKFGHTVRFYSYVPTKRAMRFGLKKECSYSIYWFAFPFLILFKLFGSGKWREDLYNYCCDLFLSYYMKPCDVFIGQSPMHMRAIKRAKKKYHALTILERGVSHVLFQQKVLESIKSTKNSMSKLHVKRDLKGYNYPDFISVGSEHVKQTFLMYGFPENKIFVNNYGVNLQFFKPTALSGSPIYDVLIVGQWCYRKGCDLIIEAVKDLNIKLLHVGTIIDIDFPDLPNFTHVDSQPEYRLIDYYKQSRVFLMPSRDEGMSLVQPQALACGLPLVCSKNSGGRDLRTSLIDSKYILEMEDYNVTCLKDNIRRSLSLSFEQGTEVRNIMNSKDTLSYKAYGIRYNAFLNKVINNRLKVK
ncbi:glycosyltransferase family 4 protein [Phocaeicola sp. Sa1CVN1]|uniref:Glycosyltransferase family 4 protein n=1 Tax=Phocaeicola intestinalis TaxID=2762212 RepID=A0ABR8YAG7_9BACT|nr:glycosyltransferase family 4 protein [Phocaeicola intestinalis]MBD8041211.1 glycosyltransferase family 4 protein [Phocaeicola intestinalis]